MQIPTETIIKDMKEELKTEVLSLREKGILPTLATILVGESPEQESFVRIKRKVADELGIGFNFTHLPQNTTEEELRKFLSDKSNDKTVHGIIVQIPLPKHLAGATLYEWYSPEKEIEGHTGKSPFLPPIGLAALTGLLYTTGQKRTSWFLAEKDYSLLKGYCSNRSVIVIGRGITAGLPIAFTLSHIGIRCQVIHSQTEDPDSLLKNADIIITGVGKRVITSEKIKYGTTLLNLGLEKREGRLRGDYNEEDIAGKAAFYTKTPGGLGPIDVLYLYKNLVEASKRQQ